MSDEADNSIDPVAARTLEVRAQALAFREAVYNSMKQYEDAVWRAGWDGGWNAGHAQGWDDAMAFMRQAAERNRADQAGPIVNPPQPEPPGPAFEESSASAVVLRIIEGQEGLRGIEILEIAERQGVPMKERTMRTALHRLKSAGKLRSVDERWYMPEIRAEPQRKTIKGIVS